MYDYIIISVSARALAESAFHAGYDVAVIDCFADSDTKSISKYVDSVAYHQDGFDQLELLDKVGKTLMLAADAKIVLAAGFEVAPELIDKLKLLAPVISNKSEVLAKIKSPLQLVELLNKHDIAHPKTHITLPKEVRLERYLVKSIGGHGGTHVDWLTQFNQGEAGKHYYQEFIDGSVFSVLFVANGKQAEVLGFNQLLKSNDFTDMPFLYKGAISLKREAIKNLEHVDTIINVITRECGLVGLCGVDYVLSNTGEAIILEVNPRPPATFELHDNALSLFNVHLAAFKGCLPTSYQQSSKVMLHYGYAILYARENLVISDKVDWPEWAKDRPQAKTHIQEKMPVCTVHARENSIDKVKALLFNRLSKIETKIIK